MPLVYPTAADSRPSARTRRDARGMTFSRELLLAVIMAFAMGATVFLYR